MHNLAQKLKGTPASAAPASVSAIFGGVGNLAQSVSLEEIPVRIGQWPILSPQAPKTAMGVGAVLSYLLERWPGVVIYRLMAQVDGDPEQYQWGLSQSQFAVDEWGLEDLDENAAIWGELTQNDGQWTLTIEAESDFTVSEQPLVVQSHAYGLAELVSKLPTIADRLAAFLDLGDPRPTDAVYPSPTESRCVELMEQLFDWELKLYLHLWGQAWSPDSLESSFDRLLTIAGAADAFGAWVAAHAFSRAISTQFDPLGETLLPRLDEFTEQFPDSVAGAIRLSRALVPLGYSDQAASLLESALARSPQADEGWLALAELYWKVNEYPAAIYTYQRAIQNGAASSSIFVGYGDRLSVLQAAGVPYALEPQSHTVGPLEFIEQLIFVENQPGSAATQLLREAALAYEQAASIEPGHVDVLYQWCNLLLELRDSKLWQALQQLAVQDSSGQRLRSLTDSLYMLDDPRPAEHLLEELTQRFPDRIGLRLSLAGVYILNENYDQAEQELEAARSLTDDDEVLAEIERLMLTINDPEFEARFGEIIDRVNAGASLSTRDVEFLEAVVEQAPRFAPGYVALATAYDQWGERRDALDVLLDGQKMLSDHPDILAMLGRLLWELDEQDLALDYLNKGLKKHPSHVGLLVLTGRYLFDSGQDEAARALLARAERSDPRHPLLAEVRAHIAREVSKRDN